MFRTDTSTTPKASTGREGKRSAPGDARASPLEEGASGNLPKKARQKKGQVATCPKKRGRRRGKWKLAQSRGKQSVAEEKKGRVATRLYIRASGKWPKKDIPKKGVSVLL
ncbi:MAG: hypothetical protein CL920_24040 [Deltaproteobacteria bacterium]|nr:hypothetical protein [Deltaproteobacteria bacterium]